MLLASPPRHEDHALWLCGLRELVRHDSAFTWRTAMEHLCNILADPGPPWPVLVTHLSTYTRPSPDDAPVLTTKETSMDENPTAPLDTIPLPPSTPPEAVPRPWGGALRRLRTLVQTHETMTWRDAFDQLLTIALNEDHRLADFEPKPESDAQTTEKTDTVQA